MLQFLPALLILMFRGPSVTEGPHVKLGLEKEAIYQRGVARKNHHAIRAFLSLSKNSAISKVMAELLQLLPEDSQASPVERTEPNLPILSEPGKGSQEGLNKCRRSRDGPSV